MQIIDGVQNCERLKTSFWDRCVSRLKANSTTEYFIFVIVTVDILEIVYFFHRFCIKLYRIQQQNITFIKNKIVYLNLRDSRKYLRALGFCSEKYLMKYFVEYLARYWTGRAHPFQFMSSTFKQMPFHKSQVRLLNEFDAKQRTGWFVSSCIWHFGVFAVVCFEWTRGKGRNCQVGKENELGIFVFSSQNQSHFLDNRLDLLFESTL